MTLRERMFENSELSSERKGRRFEGLELSSERKGRRFESSELSNGPSFLRT